MKNLKVKLLTISLLSSFAYAQTNDFVIIVDKNNSEYEMDIHFTDRVEEGTWSFARYENCVFDITESDVYYSEIKTQTETCDEIEQRTNKTIREYSTGRTEIINEETEERTNSNTIKGTQNITGTHLEASCKEALAFDPTLTSKQYTIDLPSYNETVVTCDMTTDGGGWTVFQYRSSFYDFYKTWSSYENGFGSSTNFWLGNKYLHDLTKSGSQQLYVELHHGNGEVRYAKYSNFDVANASNKYQLTVSGFSGNAGDALSSHSGHKFSTYNNDNDTSSGNCAVAYQGAWWYGSCHSSNLNGYYHNGSHSSYADGVNWNQWTGYYYSLPKTKMMLR